MTKPITFYPNRLEAYSPREILHKVDSLFIDEPLIALSSQLAHSLLLHGQPWIFFANSDGSKVPVAMGSLTQGKFRKGLVLSVSKNLPMTDLFWNGVLEFATRNSITSIQISSVAKIAPYPPIPTIANEISRYQAVKLYVVDLKQLEDNRYFSTNHKRNISRAIKAGVKFHEGNDAIALESHFQLTSASVSRRANRGESTTLRATRHHVEKILESGFGRLFQATLDGETLSSKLTYCFGDCTYYYDGGTSPSGMKIGASHFLMSQIMNTFKDAGATYFNMGLAAESSGDLWRYKAGFNPELWFVDRVSFDCTNWLKLARNAVHSILG